MTYWTLTPRALLQGHPAAKMWPYVLPSVGGAIEWLRALGVERGQRVGLAGVNAPTTAALLQALPLTGVTTVLFNRRLTLVELENQVAHARLDYLIADRAHPLAERRQAISLPDNFADQPLAEVTPLADHDAALVLFTSGTSGQAKAARLSWSAIRHAADAAVQVFSLASGTTWLGCLPLDHIGGASVIFRSGRGGGTVILQDRFAATTTTQIIDQHEINGISVVPTMLHRLMSERGNRPWPPALRYLLTGGGPLTSELIARCTALGLPPCQTYGLTEAASQVCTLLPHHAHMHPGSAGLPLPGMQVQISNGVIEVRGPTLFSGYEEYGVVRKPLAPNSWFNTGDLGHKDAQGFLTVYGRHTDLIISGGENIYPADLEAILERHPAIAEAGVYAIADAEWGQIVAVVLVAHGEPLSDAEFIAWCAINVANFKRPRRWRWATALPRTATGKLQRHLLAD